MNRPVFFNKAGGFRGMTAVAVLAFAISSPALSDNPSVVRLSDPVESTDDYETFGAPLPKSGQALNLSEVLGNGESYLGKEILVSTRVAQVCQFKGCFFIAQDGKHVARVSFKDYSFFVPSDISGRDVTLAGRLQSRDLSVEQAAHYNDDIDDPQALKPGQQYEIVATSVRVPRQ